MGREYYELWETQRNALPNPFPAKLPPESHRGSSGCFIHWNIQENIRYPATRFLAFLKWGGPQELKRNLFQFSCARQGNVLGTCGPSIGLSHQELLSSLEAQCFSSQYHGSFHKTIWLCMFCGTQISKNCDILKVARVQADVSPVDFRACQNVWPILEIHIIAPISTLFHHGKTFPNKMKNSEKNKSLV